MNIKSILLIAALACLPACTWLTTHESQLAATGTLALKEAATVGVSAVLTSGAESLGGVTNSGDYLSGLTIALRSSETSLLSASNLEQLLSIWLPKGATWSAFSTLITNAWAKSPPTSVKAGAAMLESLATQIEGLLTAPPSIISAAP